MGEKWTLKRMEAVALEEREGIGVGPHDRLDVYALAQEHGVDVFTIDGVSGFGASVEAAAYYTIQWPDRWSAALVPVDISCFIFENNAHTAQRRRANVAHEMAHLLLDHEFDTVLFTDGGCDVDAVGRVKEEQARAMAGELLIPKTAAISAAFNDRSDAEVAARFDVSVEFARMRMNASGARKIVQRSRARSAAR